MTNRRPCVGVIKRVEAVICDKEVMIIDDCSTDGTRILLKKYKEKVGVEVIFQTENSGNEAALCEDFEIAKG
jgi:glycosyltransferase involved in cell wall biosynthesis